jgi:pimeloyl-[acyl-carrier protein] methyl ester esterase
MHIILLRGLAREAAHWMQFPQQLGTALGGDYQIHCVDFPGCGIHYRQPALKTISAMTDFIRAQLAAQNIDGPLIVIGVSMGGMVALDWAQRFPRQLAGVALINSSIGDQPLHWRLRARAWLPMLIAVLSPVALRENIVLRNVSNNHENFNSHLRTWLAIQRQRPVSRKTTLTMLIAAARFRPRAQCNVDGLIIASEGDRFVSANASKDLAQRFQWPLQLHPSAGHELPLDAPAWLCAALSTWLGVVQAR